MSRPRCQARTAARCRGQERAGAGGAPGGRVGLEHGLDGSGDELRGLRVDDDVPAQQHPVDHAGGSNGYRTRAWKTELATLAVETGLEITVCQFPPGHLIKDQDSVLMICEPYARQLGVIVVVCAVPELG
jgi:hypothetical protein